MSLALSGMQSQFLSRLVAIPTELSWFHSYYKELFLNWFLVWDARSRYERRLIRAAAYSPVLTACNTFCCLYRESRKQWQQIMFVSFHSLTYVAYMKSHCHCKETDSHVFSPSSLQKRGLRNSVCTTVYTSPYRCGGVWVLLRLWAMPAVA
jgi:hypothetical protein